MIAEGFQPQLDLDKQLASKLSFGFLVKLVVAPLTIPVCCYVF